MGLDLSHAACRLTERISDKLVFVQFADDRPFCFVLLFFPVFLLSRQQDGRPVEILPGSDDQIPVDGADGHRR